MIAACDVAGVVDLAGGVEPVHRLGREIAGARPWPAVIAEDKGRGAGHRIADRLWQFRFRSLGPWVGAVGQAKQRQDGKNGSHVCAGFPRFSPSPAMAWRSAGVTLADFVASPRRGAGSRRAMIGCGRGYCDASISFRCGERISDLWLGRAGRGQDRSRHGFSLTYPEGWTSEAPSGNSIRLKIRSGEGHVCRVSENP